MPIRLFSLVALVIALTPAIGDAQLPIPLIVEVRGGYAMPSGDLGGSGDPTGAEAGLAFAAGGRLSLTSAIGIFAAYQQTRFDCSRCAIFGLDDTMLLQGMEGGLHLDLPVNLGTLRPWARGGVVYQALELSDGSGRMTSDATLGFTTSAGLAYAVMPRLEILPGVRYHSSPADFNFTIGPDQSIDPAAISIDVGLAYRF